MGSDDGAIVEAVHTYAQAGGVWIVNTWTGKVTLQTISDGTENTLMFGEKHIRPASRRGKNEDRSVFGGQNQSTRRVAGIQANTPANERRPRSR